MVTDQETDFIFLSDKLKRVSTFCRELTMVLQSVNAAWAFLTETNDIWAVDYMPVQTHQNKFVQFRFDPAYLQSPKWTHTKTDPEKVTNGIGIITTKSDIVLDGGNVIKGKGWVILTDKIFLENRSYPRRVVVRELERLLEAKPIIIPHQPYDFTGHADGVVRYYDENTVLINHYRKDDNAAFQTRLFQILDAENLETIEVPYWPYDNATYDSAQGMYINYLQVKGLVLVPVFNMAQDDSAVRLFDQLFPDSIICVVNANEIAKEGGVLNCISWNILRPMPANS